MRRCFLMLAMLLGLSGPALGAGINDLRLIELPFEGHNREFRLYIPDNIAQFPGPWPLLVALHGIASSDIRLIDKTRSQFMALADRYGFIVVYPRGLHRSWDLGQGQLAALNRPRRDDQAFVEHVIALSAGMAPVDPDRIYAVGFSQGAQMALSLACTRPGLLRSIAMVAMTVPDFLAQTCEGAPAFGVLMMHGTADPVVPYGGGQLRLGKRSFDRFLSFDQSLRLFLAQNGCRENAVATRYLEAVPDDGTSVLIRRWRGCKGADIAAYSIIGGGHQWPREPQAVPTLLGRASQEIYPAREIWRFFTGQ